MFLRSVLIASLLLCSTAFAQRSILTMPARTSPAASDVFYLVIPPGGASNERKATLQQIFDGAGANLTAETVPTSSDYVVLFDVSANAARKVLLSDLTKGLAAASATDQGVVTTGTQTFAGAKTFVGPFTINAPTYTGETTGAIRVRGGSNAAVIHNTTENNTGAVYYATIYANGTNSPSLQLQKARGTESVPSPTLQGDGLGAVISYGHSGSGWGSGASINFAVPSTANGGADFSATNRGSLIRLSTAKTGTTSVLTRLRINHDGRISLGDASTLTNPQAQLHIMQNEAAFDGIRIDNIASASGVPFAINSNGVTTGDIFKVAITGATTINDAGNDADLRIEGDTDANLLTTDASTDRVGIGTATPGAKHHINTGAAGTIGQIITLAATPTANAFEINSSAGSGGDLAKISAGGVFSSADYHIAGQGYFGNYGANAFLGVSAPGGSGSGIVANGSGVRLRSSQYIAWTNGTFDGSDDTFLTREAAATAQWGSDSVTPIAQTIKGPDGVGSNIAGANLTIAAGRGTGTGVGGEIKLQTAVLGGSGSTQNALSDAAKVDASTTAGNTRFFLYDVDNGQLERVTVGAADSGGVGFKVLRIPN